MLRLEKWYLDCVTPGGDAFIGYAGTVAMGPLRMAYAARLVAPAGAPASELHGRHAAGVAVDGGEVRLACPALGVAGRWRSACPAAEAVLYEGPGGSVSWRCVAPRADAEVEVEGGPLLRGLGYAERLSIAGRPWELPLETLLWGRFLAPEAGLAWIAWRGARPLDLAWRDGRPVGARAITREGVETADGDVLELPDGRTLREGPLAGSALAGLGVLGAFLPAKVLGAHESKWLTEGKLRRADGGFCRGWAIHEVFRWG